MTDPSWFHRSSAAGRTRHAVEDSLQRWRDQRRRQLRARAVQQSSEAAPGDRDDVVRPLDRRTPLQVLRPETTATTPPLVQRSPARAGILATLARLLVWSYAATLFFVTTLPDLFRSRQAATAHRALQLRRTLERMGGSFLKLGQQLSIRIDLLPLAYCQELSKLLDRVPAFPTEQAIAIVERTLGGPLTTAFRSFDPDPIGSASLACVYQAELLDGQRVAVKVRRPEIGRQFAADFRAMRWLLALADFFTLAPPGLGSVVDDMRQMFEEELDFKKEARSTELFAERARKAKLVEVSAPRVFFDVSSDDVLVTEFVSGFWLWEILEAVEQQDDRALALLSDQGIDPVLVARRLFRASLFGIFDNVLFHADPHPANVVVRPNSELVLIDFGACGSFSDNQVRLMRQFHSCQANDDTSGMVQCVLGLLEPLPPIDVDALARQIEAVLDASTQAARSSNAEWWERTSAGVWISFLRVVRHYGVRVNLDVLRMVRSTLLYDTLAARLYPELDIYAEYQRYRDRNARRAKRRAQRSLRQLLDQGIDDRFFLRWEETVGLSRRASYRLQRFLDSPTYRFGFLAGKAVFALSQATRCALWLLASLGIGVAGAALSHSLQERPFQLSQLTAQVLSHPGFQAVAALLVLIHLRRILLRFRDREV